jgi:hypothetical protein
MANDIILAISANEIRNGSVISNCRPNGSFFVRSERAVTKPLISEIESKYDDRFDNPSYYYGGGGGVDGGDVGDVLGV